MTQAPAKTWEQEEIAQRRSAEGLGIVYVPQIRKDRPEPAEPICRIWPENMDAFLLWCKVAPTQWHWATGCTPDGRPQLMRTGLIHEVAMQRALLTWCRRRVDAIMDDLAVIEHEFLKLERGF
jgi:hypothetical protein